MKLIKINGLNVNGVLKISTTFSLMLINEIMQQEF